MRHTWTKDEIEFLKKEYPITNRHYCSDTLGIPLKKVEYKIRSLGLKKEKRLNRESFFNIIDCEMAYILGFMWADGHVNKDGRHFNVGGVLEDIIEIETLFFKFGNWYIENHNREKYGWRNARYLRMSDTEIHKFLIDNDYDNKSDVSADKILSKIPDELKHYWFRGLIDGDGCFYYNKKQYLRQFTLASTYEQDWGYFEILCNSLDIKYNINRVSKINKKTGKLNSHSTIRINGKEILKIGTFIYSGEDFGLNRKKNKFKLIRESYGNIT